MDKPLEFHRDRVSPEKAPFLVATIIVIGALWAGLRRRGRMGVGRRRTQPPDPPHAALQPQLP